MIGQVIDHFKIIAQLGEDDRNDVWDAEDTRIGRRVAIKFLHKELSRNEIAIERFRREAQLASQLSHPNLCTILDIGNHEERPYVIMELLEGQSLKQRLRTSPPNLPRAVAWIQQLAEALDALHSHSLLHRDLNPSNIFITHRNQLKILDVGLGRLTQSNGQPHQIDFLEDREHDDYEMREIRPGRFAPSVHYLSPEQLRGVRSDHRADLFALGVIMYELLARVRPFGGNSPELVRNNILNHSAQPPSTINPYIPAELDQLTLQLLEKDRALRCQSASEFLIDLKQTHYERLSSQSLTIPAAINQLKRATITFRSAVFGIAILAILAAIFLPSQQTITDQNEQNKTSPNQAPIVVPLTSSPGLEIYPVLSPLGNQIAYSWDGGGLGNYDIYIRLLQSEHPLRLTTDAGRDVHPCWSPDGNQIAFVRRSSEKTHIVVISAVGGNEKTIYTTSSMMKGELAWSPDGEHIAFDQQTENGSAIAFVNPLTHNVTQGTSSEIAFLQDHTPAFSPNGKWLAFVRTHQGIQSDVYIRSLTDDKETQLTKDKKPIKGIDWSPDSQEVIYSSSRNGPFMLWRHRLQSQSPQLIAGTGLNATYPSTSARDNTLVHTIAHRQVDLMRIRLDRGNPNDIRSEEIIPTSTSLDYAPKISPDGSQLLYISERTGFPEIWVAKPDGTGARRVTSLSHPNLYMPTWAPDSQNILFRSQHLGLQDMYYVSSTGGRVHDASGPDFQATSGFWAESANSIHLRDNSSMSGIFKYNLDTEERVLISDDAGTAVWDHPQNANIFLAKFQRGRARIYELHSDGSQSSLDEKIIYSRSYGVEIHPDGIYFARHSISQPSYMSVYLYRFDTMEVEKVVTIPMARRSHFGYTVSNDRKWLYYGKETKDETDIIVLEHYR